ncbi:MAG TPA: hypothetical protein VFZ63_02440 [Jiangellaceae bacterium]
MDPRTLVRLAGQAMAVGGAWRSLRQARAQNDKLKLLDAAVRALTVLTTILLIVREVKQQRSAKAALDLED